MRRTSPVGAGDHAATMPSAISGITSGLTEYVTAYASRSATDRDPVADSVRAGEDDTMLGGEATDQILALFRLGLERDEPDSRPVSSLMRASDSSVPSQWASMNPPRLSRISLNSS